MSSKQSSSGRIPQAAKPHDILRVDARQRPSRWAVWILWCSLATALAVAAFVLIGLLVEPIRG
jgi:hypothetical protein